MTTDAEKIEYLRKRADEKAEQERLRAEATNRADLERIRLQKEYEEEEARRKSEAA